MDVVGEVADNCTVDGIDCVWTALENDGGAGLCEGSFAEQEKGAASAIGGLAIAEPGCKGNASSVLDGFVGEVEDDGGEASGLEKEIGGAKSLVETRPGLLFFCRTCFVANEFGGGLFRAADPEKVIEGDSIGCG